jgi:drug/metabolite transporter (DMT)-like permease
LIYLKLPLTAVFWGGTFIAGKLVAHRMHPACAAFLRFSIASLCLYLLVRWREGRLPPLTPRQIIPVLLLGLTGVFTYNIFFFSGLKHIAAGRASLIIATNPIFISLLSALFFKEPLNWIRGAGICLSVLGAMIVISNGQIGNLASPAVGLGELLIFGCVFSWVFYTLIGKVAMNSLSPLVTVTYSSIVGAGMLFIPALLSGLAGDLGSYLASDWGSLVYLGCFGTAIGFYWYYDGILKIGPMKSSVFINLVPISGVLFSYLILNEPITGSLLTGGAMVVVGVYLTNASNMILRAFSNRPG